MMKMTHVRTLLVLAISAAVFASLGGPVTSASAEIEREQGAVPENPTGQLVTSPGRYEADVEPGETSTFTMKLTNDTEDPLDVTVTSTDLGAPSNPRSVASKTEDGEFGAGDWLTPEVRDIRLEPFETISFDVVIDPPLDAPVGSNLAGLVIDSTPADGPIGTDDTDATFRIQGLLQVFLTVPGPVEHDLRVLDVDVRDTLVLGSQRFVVWEVTYENGGTVNEHVSGSFDVRSMFGNSAYRVDLKDLIVLRGAKRTQRIVWRDLPWVGSFTPELRVRGDDAQLIKATGERVVIFPWWLPVLLALTILGPFVWLWWRRRREWQAFLDEDDVVAGDAVVDDTWTDPPTVP